MRIVAIAALVPLVAVAALVGLRLLVRAWRTGHAPERLVGLGILLTGVVGVPLAAAGRMHGLVGTPEGHALFDVGVSLAAAGTACLYAFTHGVFRPRSVWATSLLAAVCGELIATAVGLAATATQGTTLAEILPQTRPWAVALVGLLAGSFAWTALEALLYWAPARRRLALGLADAVVVNRMLLWGLSSACLTALCGTLAALLLRGHAVLVEPAPVAAISVAGLVASAAWYLAFFPPAGYLRFVRERAPQALRSGA